MEFLSLQTIIYKLKGQNMSDSNQTRVTLLQKLQRNQDEHSWDDFVRYYEGYIYVVIRNLGVGVEDSQDILQEILLKIWKAIPNYSYDREKCRFRTWLCVVIRNKVYSFFKLRSSRNNRLNVSYDNLLQNLDLITDAEIDQIAEKEWQSYVSNLAWENLQDQFPKQAKEVFEASLDEEDNAVLAERFGVAESSVRVYKMRIRKAMHKEIVRLNQELGG